MQRDPAVEQMQGESTTPNDCTGGQGEAGRAEEGHGGPDDGEKRGAGGVEDEAGLEDAVGAGADSTWTVNVWHSITGELFTTVQCTPETTAYEMKQKVFEQEGLPVCQQRFLGFGDDGIIYDAASLGDVPSVVERSGVQLVIENITESRLMRDCPSMTSEANENFNVRCSVMTGSTDCFECIGLTNCRFMVQCSCCDDCSGLFRQSGVRGVHVERHEIGAKFEEAVEESIRGKAHDMQGVIPWIHEHGFRTFWRSEPS